MGDLINITGLVAPEERAWNEAMANTLAENWPSPVIPRTVTEAWTTFCLAYREQTGRAVHEVSWPWLWRHFARLSGLAPTPEDAA